MCTGIEIAAIASAVATVGGTVMQNQAMNSAQKAQANATMAELARQKKLREEAEGIFAQSQKRAGAGETAVDENIARQKREAQYTSVVSKPEDTGYAPSIQGSAPQVIQGEYNRAGTAATNAGIREGKARAVLDSFGDAQSLQNIFQGRQGMKLKNVGSFSQWSQDALDPELRAAAAKASSPFGDLLVGLGNAGMSAFGGQALGSLFGPAAVTPTPGMESALVAKSAMANGLSPNIVPFTFDNVYMP